MLLCAGEKNGIRITQENDGLRVTVSTKKEGKFIIGAARDAAYVYLKVENLTDKPRVIDWASFYLKPASGKALRALTTEEALVRSPLTAAIALNATRSGLGRVADGLNAFPNRPIPPQTYSDGLLVFEGTGDVGSQKLPVTLHLPGLLKEPIPINW